MNFQTISNNIYRTKTDEFCSDLLYIHTPYNETVFTSLNDPLLSPFGFIIINGVVVNLLCKTRHFTYHNKNESIHYNATKKQFHSSYNFNLSCLKIDNNGNRFNRYYAFLQLSPNEVHNIGMTSAYPTSNLLSCQYANLIFQRQLINMHIDHI